MSFNMRIQLSKFCSAVALLAALAWTPAAFGAAEINAAIVNGVNSLFDTDAEFLTKSLNSKQLVVGDVLKDVFTLDQSGAHGPLNGSGGFLGVNYQLAGVGTFTVTAIGPVTNGMATIAFTGTVSLYETADYVASHDQVITSTQTPAQLLANATAGTNILNLTGIVQSNGQVPITFAGIKAIPVSNPAVFGAGFDINPVGGNPGGVKIVPLGGGIFPNPGGPPWDVTAKIDAWGNTGKNKGTVPIATQTTVTFSGAVPEPTSMLLWAGLACAAGIGCARRRLFAA
ncbi:MAG TPA: hypothetical protein VGX78_20075 [Pirellulales bacterium]|jgi:hypothetical protein|nr:hypothetical protein [Pirellulales bacterium]